MIVKSCELTCSKNYEGEEHKLYKKKLNYNERYLVFFLVISMISH